MFEDIYQLPPKKVAALEWTGDALHYDYQLYRLGRGHKEFWAINPNTNITKRWDDDLKFYIEDLPDTRKCIVLSYSGEWIVKIFKKDWYPYHGYETIEIVKPEMVWSYNADFDKQMTFENNPYGMYEPNPWERDYELIWYVDPRFNPLEDKVWVFSCQPVGREILGTKDMGYIVPEVLVSFNDALPDLGVNVNECCPPYWDLKYECAYDLDRIHLQPYEDDLWVIKFSPLWRKPEDWKWIGTITPEYTVIYNPNIPKINYDIEYIIPWHDFKFEHIWMLDRSHLRNHEDDLWVFTVQVTNELDGSKTIDYIKPVYDIIYNPDLPKVTYDIDYVIPWYDFKFEHVWMLDTKHLQHGEDEIWAFTIQVSNDLDGSKIVNYITPTINVVYNTDLPKLTYDVDYVIPWHDFKFEHVWMLDRSITEQDNIWALKVSLVDETEGIKYIDVLSPTNIDSQLDVIFISYHELNAEDNWQRVLEKAPWAKRIDGVKGIYEAHKAAAKISKTDMFYVVDGDAYLLDDWQFNFQPIIFDRDCTYVWNSINPVTGLTYGFGGVKLFNKYKLRYLLKSWGTDLTLSVTNKLKVLGTTSNTTNFNTSEYNTWRTAFRESAKLTKKEDIESNERLQAWLHPIVTAEYYEWAKLGAEQGNKYALSGSPINNINDYDWLKLQFKGKLNE